MELDGVNSNNANDIANMFLKNFSNVYNQNLSDCSTTINITTNNNSDIIIEIDEIISSINSLKEYGNNGPDNVPNIFLKKTCETINFPLYLLFNLSVTEDAVPEIWKKSLITPIYKKGNKNDIKNYRPISITSSIAKVLDSIMAKKLTFSF